jgi:hypothetical protein
MYEFRNKPIGADLAPGKMRAGQRCKHPTRLDERFEPKGTVRQPARGTQTDSALRGETSL